MHTARGPCRRPGRDVGAGLRLLLLLARLAPALPVLVACAGTASHVGSGPITLSPGVRAYYERYRGLTSPSAFAVSADGRLEELTLQAHHELFVTIHAA